jgi:hypothetical protein
MKKKLWVPLAVAAVLAFPACTNKQGETEAAVFITVGLPAQPLIILVSSAAPVQVTEIDLVSHFKSSVATDPQGLANVQVSYYMVEYFRRDGGTRVPAVQQFAVAGILPSNGTLKLNGFPIMTASALSQSPFDQLLPFNGGVDRETGLREIHVFYKLTFFGQTVSGQRVQSETAIGDFFVQ